MEKFQVWNLCDEINKYNEYLKLCIEVTPYHFADYLLAEEKAEDSCTKIFVYDDGDNFALCPQVIRKINDISYMSDLKEELYDMVAPHEYSGIISNSADDKIKLELLDNLMAYSKINNIIFHFIRINPYMTDLPEIYRNSGYEVIHSNFQVYIDLTQTKEQIFKDYRSNVRRNIRRAESSNLKFEVVEKHSENTSIFKTMYQKAMNRLNARRFLYFNDAYFADLMECQCSRLAFVRNANGTVIASGVLLLGREVAYYHLACFDTAYSLLRPMNYLVHSMIMWCKEVGCHTFHLAAGGANLRQFKYGYSSTRIDYYIADKVCIEDKYKNICSDWKKKFPQYRDENYYPLYRYNEGVKENGESGGGSL